MEPAVLECSLLRLPERVAKRLRGRGIEILETEESILLKPARLPIAEARSFLKGKGFTTNEYLDMKRADKEFEA
jgi:hypothetical protein